MTDETGPYADWDYCDCRKKIPKLKNADCGCGSHTIDLPDKEVSESIIHWLGEHWLIVCAMDEASSLLDKFDTRVSKAKRLLSLTDDGEADMDSEDSDDKE